GDARNDTPLLNVCGLRIAMGNADDKLKRIAHYIAPSVEDDGVAHVVEKFILNEFDVDTLGRSASSTPNFFHKLVNFFHYH
ncbi:HAD hydrolase family protein, partial [Candidatus Parcubacteria bacterium]|nr:HAD hydrolase family protein [Candidatus Parcubacteria bacterium]